MSKKSRLSLYPLTLTDALTNLIAVKPKAKKKTARKPQAARKRGKKKAS